MHVPGVLNGKIGVIINLLTKTYYIILRLMTAIYYLAMRQIYIYICPSIHLSMYPLSIHLYLAAK